MRDVHVLKGSFCAVANVFVRRRATERYFYRDVDARGEDYGGRERLCRGYYQVQRPNDIFNAQVYGPFPPGTTLTRSGKQRVVDDTRKETGFRFRSAGAQMKTRYR
jgi:hypothetical protein